MKKILIVLSFISMSLILASCGNQTQSEVINDSKNNSIVESEYSEIDHTWEKFEVDLSFIYKDFNLFMADYSRIKTMYDVNVLIPDADFGTGFDVTYKIAGVGYLKDKNNVLDIERGVTYIGIEYKYFYVDYTNDLDYSIYLTMEYLPLMYSQPLHINNFNKDLLEINYLDNKIMVNYDGNLISEYELRFGNSITNDEINQFIGKFKTSLIYV